MFVLKTGAGFSIFKWIATLASDFLNQAEAGATFFFDADTISKHWFFVNTVSRLTFSASSHLIFVPLAGIYHLLHRIRSNDVSSWRNAMGH